MGIVAPISATSPVVPLPSASRGGTARRPCSGSDRRSRSLGVVLVSREPGGGRRPRVAAGVGLALLAALGFGLFIVGLGEAAQESAPGRLPPPA